MARSGSYIEFSSKMFTLVESVSTIFEEKKPLNNLNHMISLVDQKKGLVFFFFS